MTTPSNSTDTAAVVVWLRQDLRLLDNPPLLQALKGGRHVVPVFVYSPAEEAAFAASHGAREAFAVAGGATRLWQGLTLVHFSAQSEHFLRSFVTTRAATNGLIYKEMLKMSRKVD
jgi:deoxyribodipyrimidine photolyase